MDTKFVLQNCITKFVLQIHSFPGGKVACIHVSSHEGIYSTHGWSRVLIYALVNVLGPGVEPGCKGHRQLRQRIQSKYENNGFI